MDLDNRLGIIIIILVAIVGAFFLADNIIPGGILSLFG